MFIAKIVEINQKGVKLLIDGEDNQTQKSYKYLSSYTPKVNDRVIAEKINGTYVVIGALLPK